MKYISTRGATAAMPFMDAVMTGQAPDGGLLVPERFPDVSADLERLSGLGYTDLAFALLSHFCDDIAPEALRALVERSYATFDHEEVTPVRSVGPVHVLELFHGPTLAFKDVALQFLGNVFEHVLGSSGEGLNILGSTSGDTGSAGIEGVRGKRGIRIFVMFPAGRTSAVQERQMTTVLDENVHCLAVRGSFDDCQALMKRIFNDLEYKTDFNLGAINSVNCARLLAQVVYYFYAYFRVAPTLGAPVNFSVPTGNFGDIFAGYVARKMGLPVGKLILATNENDILRVFFDTGVYRRGEVHETLSPSMDIQVASNFERYLYYRLAEDHDALTRFMTAFTDRGEANLADFWPPAHEQAPSRIFEARSIARERTLSTMAHWHREYGYLLDPHSAVGVAAARSWREVEPDTPIVCLATAHPAKFPDAVQAAIGEAGGEHPSVEALAGRETRCHRIEADIDAVKAYIRDVCTG